jgi:hypothetical protein
LTLRPIIPNAQAGVNHVCFAIEKFDPNEVMGILTDNGLEPIEFGIPALVKPLTCAIRLRQWANNSGGPTHPLGPPELYLTDPDNIARRNLPVTHGWTNTMLASEGGINPKLSLSITRAGIR